LFSLKYTLYKEHFFVNFLSQKTPNFSGPLNCGSGPFCYS
jgi:hypothetical protein